MIDFEFAVEIYSRYHKHLQSIEENINNNIGHYERSVNELERLVRYKPQVYTKGLEQMKEKIKEADIKLSHIVPRMEKIREQIIAICQEQNITDVPSFLTKDDAWVGASGSGRNIPPRFNAAGKGGHERYKEKN